MIIYNLNKQSCLIDLFVLPCLCFSGHLLSLFIFCLHYCNSYEAFGEVKGGVVKEGHEGQDGLADIYKYLQQQGKQLAYIQSYSDLEN